MAARALLVVLALVWVGDASAAWSWDIVGRFPERYTWVYDSKTPYEIVPGAAGSGAAAVRANLPVKIVPPRFPAQTVVVVAERSIAKTVVATAARVAARAVTGPIGWGITIAGLVYESGVWKVEGSYPSGCWGYWPGGGGQCFASPQAACGGRASEWYRMPMQVGNLVQPNLYACVPVSNPNFPATPGNWPWGYTNLVGQGGPAPSEPATDAQIEKKVSDAIGDDSDKAAQVAKAAASASASAAQQLEQGAGPTSTSGPSSTPQQTITSTKTDASGTTVTVTANNTSITYGGNTITVTSSQSETTTNPDGTSSTTTVTNTGAAPSEAPPAEDPFDLCAAHPDIPACKDVCIAHPERAGCADLGDAEDVALPTSAKDAQLSPTLSAAGSCPADRVFHSTLLDTDAAISYQPLCDFASLMRPLVLALTVLGAGIFVFGAGRI